MGLETLLGQVFLPKGVGDILAVGAGLAKGYCNSQGIEINNQLLDNGLKFGPLILQAGAGACSGLIEGIGDEDNSKYSPFALKGGLLGLGLGAIEMGLGYCVGYTIGAITR